MSHSPPFATRERLITVQENGGLSWTGFMTAPTGRWARWMAAHFQWAAANLSEGHCPIDGPLELERADEWAHCGCCGWDFRLAPGPFTGYLVGEPREGLLIYVRPPADAWSDRPVWPDWMARISVPGSPFDVP